MNNNDELIITNEIPEAQPETTVEATTSAPEPEAGTVVEEAEQPTSFVEALHAQIHEEEQTQPANISLTKILAGDFFAAQIVRRQIGMILTIGVFAIVYISNRYSCQNMMIEIDNLQKELQDAKYKALSTSSQLTEKSRQSHVLDMLKACNDSDLHIADQPPYIINVEEKNE